jgi:hypothetical protein
VQRGAVIPHRILSCSLSIVYEVGTSFNFVNGPNSKAGVVIVEYLEVDVLCVRVPGIGGIRPLIGRVMELLDASAAAIHTARAIGTVGFGLAGMHFAW